LIVVFDFGFKPILNTLMMEKVSAYRNSVNNFVLIKMLHANDAVSCIEFRLALLVNDLFKLLHI